MAIESHPRDSNMSGRDRAAYQARHRSENASYRAAERKQTRARARALVRLAKLYPEAAARLVDEERAREGLPPVGVVPRGRPPAGQRHPLAEGA